MFTGLVDHTGIIKSIANDDQGCTLTLQTEFTSLVMGESIAINGICLTVVAIKENQFSVVISPETLACTHAADFNEGVLVNCERALAVGDRLGGHFVTGHIDGLVQCSSIEPVEDCFRLVFTGVQAQHQALLQDKGSVAINGVSLTVNRCDQNQFEVMIIPHTWQRTQLSTLQVTDKVNVEYDMMAKMVARQFAVNQITSEGV